MTINDCGIDFDYRDYDERGDVLYLHVGSPQASPAKALETPDGHTIEYNKRGTLIGLELMGLASALQQALAA